MGSRRAEGWAIGSAMVPSRIRSFDHRQIVPSVDILGELI